MRHPLASDPSRPAARSRAWSRRVARRAVLLLATALPVAAHAQTQNAQSFLEGVYAPYRTKGGKGQEYRQADRFFEPGLARAMARDYQLAEKSGIPPTLNGDPFVEARDWDVANLSITAAEAGDRATGIVSFTNFDQKRTLVIELIGTPDGWRIVDISGGNRSLRALYPWIR